MPSHGRWVCKAVSPLQRCCKLWYSLRVLTQLTVVLHEMTASVSHVLALWDTKNSIGEAEHRKEAQN
jgi:hypothetical protein